MVELVGRSSTSDVLGVGMVPNRTDFQLLDSEPVDQQIAANLTSGSRVQSANGRPVFAGCNYYK